MLRAQDQLVQVALPVRDAAQHVGARHVGVVAADLRPEVEFHEVALRKDRAGRSMVRDRRIGTGGDDRLEGDAVGAVLEHAPFEVAGDLLLGSPGTQTARRDQVRQCAIGRTACVAQQADLVFVLHGPQLFDEPGSGNEADGHAELVPPRPFVDRDDVTLESPTRRTCSELGDEVRGRRSGDHGPQVGDLLPHLRDVAAVGADDGACLVLVVLGGDDQRRVGSREAREVADTGQIGHQQRIEFAFGEQRTQRSTAGGVVGRHTAQPTAITAVGRDTLSASPPVTLRYMKPWLLRGLGLALVHVVVRVLLGAALIQWPLQGSVLRWLGFAWWSSQRSSGPVSTASATTAPILNPTRATT